MTAWWVTGDVLDTLAALPDDSVDLCLSSPPFLALRSYLPSDHPDKAREGGSQPTPAAFVDWLLSVCDELGRVLAPHGTLAIELGDTYAGSGGAGGDYDVKGLRDGQPRWGGSGNRRSQDRTNHLGGAGWPLDKSLSLVPEAFRLSLAYGRNVLGGEWVGEPWRVRNIVRWVRRNPPVGALGDKWRPATTDIVVACRSRTRYFDLDAVRGEPSPNTNARTAKGVGQRDRSGKSADRDGNWASLPEQHETAGAPPNDWLNISTEAFKGSHYATWPRRLCVPFVECMCPVRVCRVCGEPSRRITEQADEYAERRAAASEAGTDLRERRRSDGWRGGDGRNGDRPDRDVQTLGWTDCGHDNWRPGRVLDPFAGSGTTLAVATGHGRDAIGIDLDERNLDLARERVGMWLVETTADELHTILTDGEQPPVVDAPTGEAV